MRMMANVYIRARGLARAALRRIWRLRYDRGLTGRPLDPWRETWNPRATSEDIAYCFRLLLGRRPNPEEWPGHSSLAGHELSAIVATYLNSVEFKKRRLTNHAPGDIQRTQLHGFEIFAPGEDPHIGGQILTKGVYEPHVTRVLEQHLRPGMMVLDVGANIGFFTLLAARCVGPDGRVLAVEPLADNARLLLASLKVNDFRQVTLVPVAIDDKPGMVEFGRSFTNGMVNDLTAATPDEALAAEFLPALPLEAILAGEPRLDCIKIDIEGFEYRALSSARERIARDRPMIVSEFSPPALQASSGVSGEAYLDLLFELGYQVGVIRDDGEVAEYCRQAEPLMRHFHDAGTDHIDILAKAE